MRKLQSVQNATARQNHWHATSWSHHAGTTWTPLATHPRACQVQSGMSGSPVAVRAGASLLGRWLLPRVRQHSALSVVSWRSDLRGAANTQQLRRQNLCSRWTSLVELSSGPAAQSRYHLRTVHGHLFREAWTRRSVISDMRCLRKTLTYLLTTTTTTTTTTMTTTTIARILQTAKEFQMVDRKTVNGTNAFSAPAVTICIPPLVTDQPDVIGFSTWVTLSTIVGGGRHVSGLSVWPSVCVAIVR